MNTTQSPKSSLKIRGIQYRDLGPIASLLAQRLSLEYNHKFASLLSQIQQYQSCYGLLQLAQILPANWNRDFNVFVAEKDGQIQGLIQVAPFNQNRSTWQVQQVLINHNTSLRHLLIGQCSIGSQLLRHCFEKIWEARTWILEIDINEKNSLALYRENGFQPIAEMTTWRCTPEILAELAQKEPNLPNLLPVSNADSRLLYQLDCVSLPPTIRQVFDRHVEDFKTGLLSYVSQAIKSFWHKEEIIKAYVFEPQRKAAIGYFELTICQDASRCHEATLTVHPAYTWLYPKLLTQMASVIEAFPPQSLILSSGDYQPEREEFLEKIGALRVEQNLLMSRSVWHKLREAKPLESLKLQEMLQGLKPAHSPIPTHWQPSILDQKNNPSLHHEDEN